MTHVITQWGVRWPDGHVDEYGPLGHDSSERNARLVVANRPEAVLVHREISYTSWCTGDPEKCPNGHLRTKANTYFDPRGGRSCRPCRNEASKRSKAKKRAEQRRTAA